MAGGDIEHFLCAALPPLWWFSLKLHYWLSGSQWVVVVVVGGGGGNSKIIFLKSLALRANISSVSALHQGTLLNGNAALPFER